MTDVRERPIFNQLCAEAKQRGLTVGLETGDLVEKRVNYERRELTAITLTANATDTPRRVKITSTLEAAARSALHLITT